MPNMQAVERILTDNAANRRKRHAFLMRELEAQQRMGEMLVKMERTKAKKISFIRGRSIVIDGNIPARIIAYDNRHILLQVGEAQYTVRIDWIADRFKYGADNAE